MQHIRKFQTADGRRTRTYVTLERGFRLALRNLREAQRVDDQMRPDEAEQGLRMLEEDLATLTRQTAELRLELGGLVHSLPVAS